MKMVEDAIKKLKEALIVNPRNYEAIWSLGITYGRFGILIPELDMAKGYFAEAAQYFQQAVDGDPSNDCYARSLRLIATFPKVHEEIYKYAECFFGRPLRGHGSSTYSNAKVSEKKRASDLKCDIVGWVILAVGIFVWLGTSKSHERPPPPR
ncbi:Plant specific mitochondrial import receptor subunit TOM20 [Macleaya cordata]|uniref:Plant specific mitochondrial import receptor subunit TOM20 n=1 Tax=Macleaya cordata TaxID=56857 RepID=A0A200R9N5_MACCD|nr:Plant specific mitochondrial import receptor subunit TOM20 [Macleaya cordata]